MAAPRKLTILLVIATTSLLGFIPTVVGQTACQNAFLSADESVQYFTSPSYPSNYSNNVDCQWILTSENATLVVLKLLNFQLDSDCSKDYVTIYDGYGTSSTKIATLCGAAPQKEYASSGSNMTVVFHSDSSNTFRGFRFLYTTAGNESYGIFQSNFPAIKGFPDFLTSIYSSTTNNYISNFTHTYLITTAEPGYVIGLKVVDFVLEPSLDCAFDNVKIYDGSNTSFPLLGTMCGTLTSGLIAASGPAMTVIFRSDFSLNFKGYSLNVGIQDKSVSCSSGVLQANSTAASLTSPNYPYQYPSSIDCQWLINASSSSDVVVLTLTDLNLNGENQNCLNNSDNIKIYDGPSNSSREITTLCGQYSDGTFNSTGSQMTIAFHSEGVHNNTKSFSFTYKSKNNDKSNNSAGILAAAQMSILPLILLIYQLLY